MFSPQKMRALALAHSEELALQLQEASEKDAGDLNAQSVIRKAQAEAADAENQQSSAEKNDEDTPAEDTVTEVPEGFEAQVVAGFDLLTQQMTAMMSRFDAIDTRIDDVEKGLKGQQAATGSSRASLSAWLQDKTKSATESDPGNTPSITNPFEMAPNDPLANAQPKAADPANGHVLGGL